MSDIDVLLELDPALTSLVAASPEIDQAISQSIGSVAAALGIPGRPIVRTRSAANPNTNLTPTLRLYVNGVRCRYPVGLFRRVHSVVTDGLLLPGRRPEGVRDWLLGVAGGNTQGVTDGKALTEFLSVASAEIVKRRASVLFGAAQAAAYARTVPALQLEGPSLQRILGPVLDLGLSVANTEAVSEVLRVETDQSMATAAERLIVKLRPEVVEVLLPQQSLQSLTSNQTKRGPEAFSFLREGFFEETGIQLPVFRFVPDERLRPRHFGFKINHLPPLPWVGLEPGQCMVNGTAERLAPIGLSGFAARNPASEFDNTIIDVAAKPIAEKAGLATWDQLDYFILCFAASLRERSGAFVDTGRVEHTLRLLERALPSLVSAATATISLEQMTRILRALVSERVPIRNLKIVLEAMVDYGLRVEVSNDDNLLAFVRSGMSHQIRHGYAGSQTIPVYLLDRAIEELSVRLAPDDDHMAVANGHDQERDRVIESILAEVDLLPPLARVPVLLTSGDARQSLRRLIADDLPVMPVLAFGELPPDTNVQPIARIALGG